MDGMDVTDNDYQPMEIDEIDEEMLLEEFDDWCYDSDDDASAVLKAMISRDNQEEVQISSQYEVKSSSSQDNTNHLSWDHTFDSSSSATLIGSPGYPGVWNLPKPDETTTGSSLMNPKPLNENRSEEKHCCDEINEEDVAEAMVLRDNKEGAISPPQDEATNRESSDNTYHFTSLTTSNLQKLDETVDRGLLHPKPLNDLMANVNHYHDTTNEVEKYTARYDEDHNKEVAKSTPDLTVHCTERPGPCEEDPLDDCVEAQLQMGGGNLGSSVHIMKSNEEHPEEKSAEPSEPPTFKTEPTPVAISCGTFPHTDWGHAEEKFPDDVEPLTSILDSTAPTNSNGNCSHSYSKFAGLWSCSLAEKAASISNWYSYFDLLSSASNEKLEESVLPDAIASTSSTSGFPNMMANYKKKDIQEETSREHQVVGSPASTEKKAIGYATKPKLPSGGLTVERALTVGHDLSPDGKTPKHRLDDLGQMVNEMMKHELQRRKATPERVMMLSRPDAPALNVPKKSGKGRTAKFENGAWFSREESLARCGLAGKTTPKAAHHDRFRDPAQATNDICVVFDDLNKGMDKLIPPLISNFEKLWDLLCCSPDEKLRMSVLTSSEILMFTSSKSEVISFFKNAAQKRQRPEASSAGIEGLLRSLARVRDLDWIMGSFRYVYIFTNFSDFGNGTDKRNRKKELSRFRSLVLHLPLRAEILFGKCKLRDGNDVLLESLKTMKRGYKTFAFLDVKEMASFVVRNDSLLKALFAIVKQADKSNTKITILDKPKLDNPIRPSAFRNFNGYRSIMEATRYQYKPPASVQGVISNAELMVTSRHCSIQVESTSARSRDKHFSLGMVHEYGKPRFCVMLKSLKIDTINCANAMLNHELYRKQAIVSAQAIFLAGEYNDLHRPEHCAKIWFLRGHVIEEAICKGGKRVFYAEEFVDGSERFTEYCDAAGNWNERHADESLLRFAQTCFKLSGGDFILAGLKGVRRGGYFVLQLPSLLSRTCSDPHACQCNKEYMTACRKGAKALLEENGWKK